MARSQLLKAHNRLMPPINVVLALFIALLCVAETANGANSPAIADLLSFDSANERALVGRWHGLADGLAQLDETIVQSGRRSVRMERDSAAPGQFSALTMQLPIEPNGSKIELHGWLRTAEVSGFAGLWIRTNRGTKALSIDNMSSRGLKGSNDWAEFAVTVPLSAEVDTIAFGVLLSGTGKLWADTLQLFVDGKPYGSGSGKPQALKGAPQDFGAVNSGVRVTRLTTTQIEGLFLLGRVWGFLKFHHPRVTAGEVAWDAELLRMLPGILNARNAAGQEGLIVEWIDSLGQVSQCNPCAQLPGQRLQLAPRLEWLEDRELMGDALRDRLRGILANRKPGQQFYVSLTAGVGNPSFDNEPDYARVPLPDAGFQLLALFRFWSAVEYWFPYRSMIETDWAETLREFIPRIAEAATRQDYQLELFALIARVGDSHANLWSSISVRPPAGKCQLPVNIRFIEGLPVVSGYSGAPGDFRLGDVLERLDGAVMDDQVKRWHAYYSGSNEGSRLRDMGRFMTRGECGPTTAVVKRNGRRHTIEGQRLPPSTLDLKSVSSNELEGPAFRMLAPEVAYLKVSTVKRTEISTYIEAASKTEAIVVDLRGYPSEFVVFKLGGHFVDRQTPFVRFSIPDLSNPGAFHWMEPMSLKPEPPHYDGKVLVLVDESTQSQAEYTAMALRAAPKSMLVGSATAGADGNVSRLPLPGGLWSLMSGIGVYYPDKKPTQRVGIEPDVVARATISGIGRGEDEVLAAALRQIIRGAGAEKKIANLSKRSVSESTGDANARSN